jgi:hypothetical protein
MEFELIWRELRTKLSSRLSIPNWTVNHGYFRGLMTIAEIDDDFVRVDSPNAKHTQTIPKRDFEEVWKIWADYKNGKFRRGDMTELTRYSKYIISIFHWLEMTK